MVYKLIKVNHVNNTRNKEYVIKDIRSGITHKIDRLQVLELFKRGESVRGLKLSKDNKVLIDKDSRVIKDMVEESQNIPIKKIEGIEVTTGKDLYSNIVAVDEYEHRDVVGEIIEGIRYNRGKRVVLLHGIRRTGKTTAIWHAISKLIAAGISDEDIVYVEIYSTKVSIWELQAYLKQFNSKIIFVDEVTKLTDFVTSASFFSNTLTTANRVVLAGTDSYAFIIAMIDSLHDRYININFTDLRYTEYLRLFDKDMQGMTNTDKLNNFKLYGGVLSKKEYGDPIQTYVSIQNAIVENIVNTVLRNSTYMSTPDYVRFIAGHDIKILVTTVVRSILSVCSISRGFETGVLKNVNLNKEAYHFIDETTSNIESYIESELEEKSNESEYDTITAKLIKAMMFSLAHLRVVSGIKNLTSRIEADTTEYYDATKLKAEIVCLIPSLVFSILSKMNKRLKDTVKYRDKDISGEINGILTENIVVSQCILAKYDVNFLRYELTEAGLKYYGETNLTPEIDCIITTKHKDKGRRVLIEVKHSSIPKPEHAKNLRLKSVEHIVGKDTKKLVVYMGETTEVKGIPYVNIHDFLTDMKHWIEG